MALLLAAAGYRWCGSPKQGIDVGVQAEKAMASVQSGSVYNNTPTSAGMPNRASPAGSVHLPYGMLQPFANAQQLVRRTQHLYHCRHCMFCCVRRLFSVPENTALASRSNWVLTIRPGSVQSIRDLPGDRIAQSFTYCCCTQAPTQQTHTWSNNPGAVPDPAGSPGNPFASAGQSPGAATAGGMPTPSAPNNQHVHHNTPASLVQSACPSSNAADVPGSAPEALAPPQHAEAPHAACGAHSTPAAEAPALASLAASVVDRAPLHVRPTSTQEGTEAPVVPSDDDTIEMRAGGSGHRVRGRRTGSSVGGTAAPPVCADAVAVDAAVQTPPPHRAAAAAPAARPASPADPPLVLPERQSCSGDATPSAQHPQPPGVALWRSSLLTWNLSPPGAPAPRSHQSRSLSQDACAGCELMRA